MSPTSRRIVRILTIGSVAALATMSFTACAAGDTPATDSECTPVHEFETVEPGKLTIASYDYPPATLLVGDGLSGIEGDLLTKIAEMECLTIAVTTSGGANAVIPSVQTGRADLGTGSWYRTTERAKIVHLGAPLWADAAGIVSITGIMSDDLEGSIVGSVAGNLWNDSLQKWLGDDFKIYQDEESIYGDLAAGRIDAIVASATSGSYRLQTNPIEGGVVTAVTPNSNVSEFAGVGQVMFPMSLENEALSQAIDDDINTLREDGTIGEVLEEYGMDPSFAETGEPSEL